MDRNIYIDKEINTEQGWDFALWFFVQIARFYRKERITLSLFLEERIAILAFFFTATGAIRSFFYKNKAKKCYINFQVSVFPLIKRVKERKSEGHP